MASYKTKAWLHTRPKYGFIQDQSVASYKTTYQSMACGPRPTRQRTESFNPFAFTRWRRTKSAAPLSTTDRLRRNGTFALSNAFSIVREPITLPRLVLAGPWYRPRDGSVVSSPIAMNDPQRQGHMASYLGRRKFLAAFAGAAAWPLAARARSSRRCR